MGEQMRKTRERLEEEFKHISSNEVWTDKSIETMKNVLKSMYYIDVICAMKDGDEYPGSDYMRKSYAPHHYGMSGRRYYDDEKHNATQKLYRMMESEENGEVRAAIQSAIRELER